MTPELFEQLLHEDESVSLDFKEGQYAFSVADDLQKSEILKDILGFVNAWRRGEAYILIGVREVKGGRSDVAGIDATTHLDDHSLQQFVNAKANDPVR
ncbi:MAG: ATP-binding protein, partial [Planctomycetia bacterium]